MSSNRILRSSLVGKIVKEGKEVATQLWTKPGFVAGFMRAVEQDPRPLPEGTAKVILRERDPSSDNDLRTHYTIY